jgi:hypothetical protein
VSEALEGGKRLKMTIHSTLKLGEGSRRKKGRREEGKKGEEVKLR